MQANQPCRSRVLKVGESAFLKLFRCRLVYRQQTIGIVCDVVRFAANEIGRVQPSVALLVQVSRSFSDGLGASVIGIVGFWNVGSEIFREREGLEGRRGSVAWAVL